jgi:phosphate transport system protein
MTIQAVQAQPSRRKITSLLVTMGLKVDQAVEQAIAALLHSSTHASAGLMENVVAIQELEITLDQAVFAALESGDLPASDVRQAASVVNISKDLARLGKLAANLGRKVSQVGEHHEHEDFSRLQPLAIAVSHLCRQTLQSLTRMNPVLAHNAAAGSASVDAYRDYVFRGLRGPAALVSDEQNAHLIFASRCLEQIADYAVDLAENLVVFLGSGPCPVGGRPETRQQVAS